MGFVNKFMIGVKNGDERSKEIYKQTRWRLNVISLSLVGFWPYQKKRDRMLIRALIFVFCSTVLTVQIRKVYIERHNMKIIIDAMAPMIFEAVASTKVVNNIVNLGKMYRLLNVIEKDWEEIEGEERKILIKFANQGHIFNILYGGSIYISMVGFFFLPIAPTMIYFMGVNITDPLRFQIPIDYNMNIYEHWLLIETHIFLAVITLCMNVVATDMMFITLVQHACGMFAAVSNTLETLAEEDDPNLDLHPDRVADKAFWVVIRCIKKQNSILQYAELLEAYYSWPFLLASGLNMTIITFTGYQMTMRLDSLAEALQQGIFTLGNISHLFFLNYLSQRLTDHSLCIFEALKKTKFYNTSIRTRKLLNLMILRSVRPCEMKAGKLFVMSMENFSLILRTSMSYFTMLRSVQ